MAAARLLPLFGFGLSTATNLGEGRSVAESVTRAGLETVGGIAGAALGSLACGAVALATLGVGGLVCAGAVAAGAIGGTVVGSAAGDAAFSPDVQQFIGDTWDGVAEVSSNVLDTITFWDN